MFKNLSAPKLIVNKAICEANIQKMVSKINAPHKTLRPHFKTHNSQQIGNWFRPFGVKKITVTTPEMALKFIEDGWNDITVAMPFNPHWIPFVNAYSSNVTFNILIENESLLELLENNLINQCHIFLKIDLGSKRTGVLPDNMIYIQSLISRMSESKNLIFGGFLGHAGHTYHCSNTDEIKGIYKNSVNIMRKLKAAYINQFPDIITSYGDTPSCSLNNELNDFDEYRPGNFVFYDLMQYHLGVCHFTDISIVLACPVLAKHEDRNEILLHCGAVHLSKEFITTDGVKIFGQAVVFSGNGTWKMIEGENYLVSLLQEHGILKVDDKFLKMIKVGDTLGIIPVHSCLTANQMRYDYNFI